MQDLPFTVEQWDEPEQNRIRVLCATDRADWAQVLFRHVVAKGDTKGTILVCHRALIIGRARVT
jgi:hypothetical protein